MLTLLIISTVICVIAVFLTLIMNHTATKLGPKGRHNLLTQYVISIIGFTCLVPFGILWRIVDSEAPWYVYTIVPLIGVVVAAVYVYLIMKVREESDLNFRTAKLCNIEMRRAGRYRIGVQITGTIDGKISTFLLHEADKRKIKELNLKNGDNVWISYYSNNNRIVDLKK